MTTYDSQPDTIAHIDRVRTLLFQFIVSLIERAAVHDRAKLEEPEKSAFDRVTPLLRTTTYDSSAYHALLQELGAALAHHYALYDHHPQHFPNGMLGMTLLALLECTADWKAAGERHADGSFMASLLANERRFSIDTVLMAVIANTAAAMGWIPAQHPWRNVEPLTRAERQLLARLLDMAADAFGTNELLLDDTPEHRELLQRLRAPDESSDAAAPIMRYFQKKLERSCAP